MHVNETLDVDRATPAARSYSKAFWEGTQDRKVLLQFDRRNERYQFFPRPLSIYDGRRGNLEWREVSGKGLVHSFTVARRAPGPLRGKEPFFIVVVQLDEGVNVMANVANCPFDEMRIGLRMKPYWHSLPGGAHLLMFEPDRS